MSIKNLIGYILLGLIIVGVLGLCFYAFLTCGYSILLSILFTLLTCVVTGVIVGLGLVFFWLFD